MSVLILMMLTSAAVVVGQRPFFAGLGPIGYPDIPKKTTTVGLADRVGEGDSSTPKLPLEANGDWDLIDRLSKLPIDNQPFWFINWQALEAHRKKPQTYPQRPGSFIDPIVPENDSIGSSNSGIANSNSGIVSPGSGADNRLGNNNSTSAAENNESGISSSTTISSNSATNVNANFDVGNRYESVTPVTSERSTVPDKSYPTKDITSSSTATVNSNSDVGNRYESDTPVTSERSTVPDKSYPTKGIASSSTTALNSNSDVGNKYESVTPVTPERSTVTGQSYKGTKGAKNFFVPRYF